jgi:hypothetical protein
MVALGRAMQDPAVVTLVRRGTISVRIGCGQLGSCGTSGRAGRQANVLPTRATSTAAVLARWPGEARNASETGRVRAGP